MSATATGKTQERLIEIGPQTSENSAPAAEAKTFRPYDPGQVLLISPVLSEWVPSGDLAHFVSELVDQHPDYRSIARFRARLPRSARRALRRGP